MNEVKVDKLSNDQRVYHVNFTLTEKVREDLVRNWDPADNEKYQGQGMLPNSDNPILQTLVSIPGVKMASCMPYELSITKAGAFAWEPIEEKIGTLIEAFSTSFDTLEGQFKRKRRKER